MPDIPDLVDNIAQGAENGEVEQTPCPLEGPPDLAWLLGRRSRRLRVLPLEVACDGPYAASSKWTAGGCHGQGAGRGGENAGCDSVLLLHASDAEVSGRELVKRQSSRGGSHGFEC